MKAAAQTPMFTRPPFLVSYTVPGALLQFEEPRSSNADYFPFVGGDSVQHWPQFSNLDQAYSALWYVRQTAPQAEIYDILHAPDLPPDVGRWPVPIMSYAQQEGDTSGIYIIYGDLVLPSGSTARVHYFAGALSDAQQGLRTPLTTQYLNIVGAQNGTLLTGKPVAFDRLYAYVSENTPETVELYWGDASTGPVLNGLA